MKIYLSTTSPFGRLCLIAAYRAQKPAQLVFVKPWENPPQLEAVNPYNQVPALELDNGVVMTESLVIMQTLTGNLFQDEQNNSRIGFAVATLNQAARFMSMKMVKADEATNGMQARSVEGLKRALPHAPKLNPNADDWGNICLGVAYRYVQMRLPEIYAEYLSADNQQALETFCQRDFMRKTETSELEKLPASIAEL